MPGCSGHVFDHAYTASGDGYDQTELVPDAQFSTSEDLNVVVNLNKHKGQTLPVSARFFIDASNQLVGEVSAQADEETENVVLGLDFQARDDPGNFWLKGRYRVEVRVNGELVETLYFRVD